MANVPLEIMPLTGDHLDAAAVLLAERQRAHRRHEPSMPERYTEPAAVRPLIEEALAWDGAEGFAAVRDQALAGYLIGRPWVDMSFLGTRAGWVDYAGHAVRQEDGGETYAALYAAMSSRWLAAGCFDHYVMLPASDRPARAAWFALGFGQEHVRAVREVPSSGGEFRSAEVDVRQAGEEDLIAVVEMRRRLEIYHTGSPMFDPYPADLANPLPAETATMLTGTEWLPLIAVRGTEVLGINLLSPPTPRAVMASPDRCLHLNEAYIVPSVRGSGVGTALLDAAFGRARSQGYGFCSVGWHSANLLAARFWLENGFRPVMIRLLRSIDPRIAWARSDA